MTNMVNISFLACTKDELQDLTGCIVVNGEIFSAETFTFIGQCPSSFRDIFIPYNMSKFQVGLPIIF